MAEYIAKGDNYFHGLIIDGNSEMYRHPVTLTNTASFLGPSRTGIIYHQIC
jgi:hypothetical protein